MHHVDCKGLRLSPLATICLIQVIPKAFTASVWCLHNNRLQIMSSCHPLSHQSWHQNTSKSLNLPKNNINRSTLFWLAWFRPKTGLYRMPLNFISKFILFYPQSEKKKGTAHPKMKIEIVCSSSCRKLATGKVALGQTQWVRRSRRWFW